MHIVLNFNSHYIKKRIIKTTKGKINKMNKKIKKKVNVKLMHALLLLLPIQSFAATNDFVAVINEKSGYSMGEPNEEGEIPPVGDECITREALIALIAENANVENVNTSCITDFSGLFKMNTDFNQDISGWDVSNGIDFSFMFGFARSFNQDLSGWNMSKAENLSWMFSVNNASFPLNEWDVSNVKNFSNMFNSSGYNQPLDKWDVSSGTDFSGMFQEGALFNHDISGWNVSNGLNFNQMFLMNGSFQQDISGWNVEKATSWNDFTWGDTSKIPEKFR